MKNTRWFCAACCAVPTFVTLLTVCGPVRADTTPVRPAKSAAIQKEVRAAVAALAAGGSGSPLFSMMQVIWGGTKEPAVPIADLDIETNPAPRRHN